MTAPFRILIVEDELLIAEMLKEMLLDLGYEVSGIATSYAAALRLLETGIKPDLCFLDINLQAERSGFDLAKEIGSFSMPFVFLTSYSDKKTVGEAALLKPEAYLVKPFTPTDLLTTIEIIRARKKNTEKKAQGNNIVIRDGGLQVKISTSDIYWLKSDNIYVEVKTQKKKYLVRNSLERFMEELRDEAILRTHRSFAVNVNHVNAVNGQYLIIEGEKIPLSRKFRNDIHSQFNSG